MSSVLTSERLLRQLLILPYLLGLLWTTLHPVTSVITGELKCRGPFIDENGLDVHRHSVPAHPTDRRPVLRAEDARRQAAERRRTKQRVDDRTGICDAFWSFRGNFSSSIECLRHEANKHLAMDVLRILPEMGPMIDSTDAIVLVVDSHDWYPNAQSRQRTLDSYYHSSDFSASLVHMIQRLGRKEDCPWLTKAIFIVSPAVTSSNSFDTISSTSHDLARLVETFLASYSIGTPLSTDSNYYTRPLPPAFTYPIIRCLLVLSNKLPNASVSSNHRVTELRVLPQGIGGALPNLDLVFATLIAFQSKPWGQSGNGVRTIFYDNSEIRVHPFGKDLESNVITLMERWGHPMAFPIGKLLQLDNTRIVKAMTQYAKDLGGWIGFLLALVIGPTLPHAPALNHGIDSLTIEILIPNRAGKSSISIHPHFADFTRCIEHLLRSISNLHERLHHSIALYTMPSPWKFVSHGEYIFPLVLVTLPMVVRSAMLAFRDLNRFRFQYISVVIGAISMITFGIGIWVVASNKKQTMLGNSSIDKTALFVYFAAYSCVFLAARWGLVLTMNDGQITQRNKNDVSQQMDFLNVRNKEIYHESQSSLRFVACLAGIYLHVPLLLSHYTLVFPSSVFWTPLLAIFVLPRNKCLKSLTSNVFSVSIMLLKICFLAVTSPPVLLVPRIFSMYTTYVMLVYTPLHLFLSTLWLMG